MQTSAQDRSPDINSVQYWNDRFAHDWEQRGGSRQTRFFAEVLVNLLPRQVIADWTSRACSVVDVGCAMGDACSVLSAQFPQLAYLGVDVAATGIAVAQQRYRHAAFQVIEPDWSDLPEADYLICSNTLEHLTDWRARLAVLSRKARTAVVMLVPYREQAMDPEHVTRFDERLLPKSLGDTRLIYLRAANTTRWPGTCWHGQQLLAVYAADAASSASTAGPRTGTLFDGLALHGLDDEAIEALLLDGQVEHAIEPAPAGSPDTDATFARMNDEWAAKFDAMIRDYNGKLEQAVVAGAQQIEAAETEIRELQTERDAGVWQAQVAEQRLALAQEGHAAHLAQAQEVARETNALLTRQLALERTALEERLAAREAELASVRRDLAVATAAHALALTDAAQRHKAELEHAARMARDTGALMSATFDLERRTLEQTHALRGAELDARHEADRFAAMTAQAEIERLQELSAQLRIEREQRLVALAAVQRDLDDAAAEVARLAGENEALRRRVTQAEGQTVTLHQHYESHLDGINRYLDQIAADIAGQVEQLVSEAANTAASLFAAAQYNTAIARSALSVNRRGLRGRVGAAMVQLFGPKPAARQPVTLPNPPPTAQPQTAQTHIAEQLALLRYRANFAGAAKRARDVVEPETSLSAPETAAPAVIAPVAIVTAAIAPAEPVASPCLTAGRSHRRVLAMQLDVFDSGGLEKVVFDLCCGLRDAGEQVLVLCRQSGLLGEALRGKGIAVLTFADADEYGTALVDHGITHVFQHHSYFGFALARAQGIRLFDVVHNSYFWKIDQPEEVRTLGHDGDGVICVSQNVRDFHVRAFGIPAAQTHLINNPVNVDGLILPDPEQLRRIRSGQSDTTFLNVANVYPAKAQVALISAFARAWRQRRDLRLLIAGAHTTPHLAQLMRDVIRDEALGDAVTLLGQCDRRTLSRHYAEAHAFVLPSIFEGYSVSAVEAAAFGLPLVLTDVGGARDLVENGDCGILLPAIVADLTRVRSPDVEALSTQRENGATAALTAALLDVAEKRAAWIERGMAAMAKPHSLERAVREYRQVLDDCDARAAPSAALAASA